MCETYKFLNGRKINYRVIRYQQPIPAEPGEPEPDSWEFVIYNELTREYSTLVVHKFYWKKESQIDDEERDKIVKTTVQKKKGKKGLKRTRMVLIRTQLDSRLERMLSKDYQPLYPKNPKTRIERLKTVHELRHKYKPDKLNCKFCNPDLVEIELDYYSPEHIAFHQPHQDRFDCLECAHSWQKVQDYKTGKIKLRDILSLSAEPKDIVEREVEHSEDCDCARCIPGQPLLNKFRSLSYRSKTSGDFGAG